MRRAFGWAAAYVAAANPITYAGSCLLLIASTSYLAVALGLPERVTVLAGAVATYVVSVIG